MDIFMDSQNDRAFSMIADIEGDFKDLIDFETPDEVPILPVRNLVLFPGVVSPILIGRDSSMTLVKRAESKKSIIGIVCQRDPEVEHPGFDDLYEYGVFAKVVKQLNLPNGSVTAIIQGLGRLRLKSIVGTKPYLVGQVEPASEVAFWLIVATSLSTVEPLRQLAERVLPASEVALADLVALSPSPAAMLRQPADNMVPASEPAWEVV